MSENQAAQASPDNHVSAMDVYGKAFMELPSATGELAKEAWEHPVSSIGHGLKTVASSVVVGSAMGYFLPAKGPAAWAVGIGLTVPLVIEGYKNLTGAAAAAQKPGADVDQIAHTLARHTVGGTTDLILNLAGGIGGTEAGYSLKETPGRVGSIGQSTQRTILETENKFLAGTKNNPLMRGLVEGKPNPKLPVGTINAAEALEGRQVAGLSAFDRNTVLPEHMGWLSRPFASIGQRIRQYENRDVVTGVGPRVAKVEDDYILARGAVHLHTKESDGMGTVTSMSEKAKEGGINVALFSDHNHLAARGGVKPGDPRVPAEDVPVIAESPKWYTKQFAEAREQTENGKFVALIGTEMGTIGKVGNPHSGGKNHYIMAEMPAFFEARRRQPTLTEMALAPLRRVLGMKAPAEWENPQVIKYNDGDMNGMITDLEKYKLKDTTGQDPIFIMAHPRWTADHADSIPAGSRGADYGRYSFKTKDEWVTRTDKYWRGIEVIKGEALNQKPIPEVGAKDIDFTSFKGYINEGFHVSPTVGRDAHYGNPVGNPAETGIWVNSIDKNGALEGFRSRRTFATTHMERLNGRVIANDRYQMGSILDQAVTNELALTTKMGGQIDPKAEYTFKLWGDTKVGDRTMADIMQQKDLTGQELSQMGNQFTFDKFQHTLGNKGAYFVEVTRKDPITDHTDHMYMAPFWVEPLSGGGKPSLFMKFLAGAAPTTLIPTGN